MSRTVTGEHNYYGNLIKCSLTTELDKSLIDRLNAGHLNEMAEHLATLSQLPGLLGYRHTTSRPAKREAWLFSVTDYRPKALVPLRLWGDKLKSPDLLLLAPIVLNPLPGKDNPAILLVAPPPAYVTDMWCLMKELPTVEKENTLFTAHWVTQEELETAKRKRKK